MNSLRPILLVEDSKKDIELTLAALAETSVANKVIVQNNGEDALAYLRETLRNDGPAGLPVVLLLDIKMPKVTGIEVLKALETDPLLNQIPVVMLTSSREGPDVDECYRYGVNAYVVKPVNFEGFFQAVKDVGRFWAVVNTAPGLPLSVKAGAATAGIDSEE